MHGCQVLWQQSRNAMMCFSISRVTVLNQTVQHLGRRRYHWVTALGYACIALILLDRSRIMGFIVKLSGKCLIVSTTAARD